MSAVISKIINARPSKSNQRHAVLKGGAQGANIGDVMMRSVSESLIASMGFKIEHRVNHREITGSVANSVVNIDAIFVLGAIQYSDAWASSPLLERLERSIRFHSHFPDAKIYFLPSTWGPFSPDHRNALENLLQGATVLARDRASTDSINALLGRPVAEYCPDFAFLYPRSTPDAARPKLNELFGASSRPLLGIMPNIRCVERGVTPLEQPEAYIDTLRRIRDRAIAHGCDVVGISHMLDNTDMVLLRDLGIPFLETTSPEMVRSVIANLDACVSSRYHGVISCLSHEIPVVALGWTDKYSYLMDDMELSDFHLSLKDLTRAETLFDQFWEDRQRLSGLISHRVELVSEQVRQRATGLIEQQ